MKSMRKAERAIRGLDVQPRSEMHRKTLSDLTEAHVAQRDGRSKAGPWIALAHPALRGLAAAALIVLALAALVCFQHFTAPAYAIEQTIEALRKTSIVHILGRDWDDKQIEIWSKVNSETGLIDHWYVHHIDDEMLVVSTPQNTSSYDSRTNAARIQEGPSVASFFRLGEFFESMEQLAEKYGGQVTYAEVADPATKRELIELTMSAPRLGLRSLIDPKTKLPVSIDVMRGGKPGPHDMLKHATKITYDDVPPKGVFDFTIPAGATIRMETLEDALADMPVAVIRYCGRVHQETIDSESEPNGIRTNTQIYLVDEKFNLRRGGFIAATNDSNDIVTGEMGVSNFDLPHLAVFDANSGKKQQIRLVQHRLTGPGRFRLHWNLDEPLRPGQTRYGLYWVTNSQELPKGPDGNEHRLRLSNTFGGEGIENFVLVIRAGTAVYDYSRPYVSRDEVEGYNVYLWHKTLPEEAVENTVEVSLSSSGADYSADYIARNRSGVLVEIPEMFELANIVIAITDPGLNEEHRVNKRGTYYERVLEHFLPFKDHPLISESDVTRNYGYFFRDNSICYRFEGERIVHAGQYFSIRRPDLFRRQLALLENFARVSNFRQFYCDNLPYYERQIQLYRRKIPVRRMWTWLEGQFPNRHDCYKIVFSPLLGASHETCGFANDGFSETIMFVSGPGESPDTSDPVAEGCLSRAVFTEIDHNYVNRITRDHLDRVNEAFADLGQWNQQDGYKSPEMTFNEYMTWAVFVLYAYDTYDADDAESIVERSTTSTMVHWRKFVRFDEFARELLRLYRNRATGQTIGDLYPAILEWAEGIAKR